jgi:hypothetical protein
MRLHTWLIATAIVAVPALATPATAAAQGAVVQHQVSCGISLGGFGPGAVETDQARVVQTPSGNSLLVCFAKLNVRPTRAIILRNLPCSIEGAITSRSQTVISAGGAVVLTCALNGRVRHANSGGT